MIINFNSNCRSGRNFSFYNFMSEYSTICFRNKFNWNIIFGSNSYYFNFFRLVRNNNFFFFCSLSNIYWNIMLTSNNDCFKDILSNRLINFIIYFDDIFFKILLSWFNRFINENRLINFWNNSNWNVMMICNFNYINFSLFWNNRIFNF